MADDKIRISWDDMRAPDVEEKLRQREALEQAQEHYREQMAQGGASGGGNLWHNTLFYMAVFGLAGGLVAWACGEMVEAAQPDHFEEFLVEYCQPLIEIEEKVERGDISEEEAARRHEDLAKQYGHNPYVELEQDETLSEQEFSERFEALQTGETVRSIVGLFAFFAVTGIVIAVFLGIADPVVGRNPRGALVSGSIAAALGLMGGVVGGICAQILYSKLLSGAEEPALAQQIFARSLGWAIMGTSLAIAPGIVLRSGKRLGIGVVGGLLGGLIGGCLFDPIAMMTDSAVISRLVQLAAIGAIAGAGTGLIEQAVKSGWLRVTGGLIVGKQFILYRNPTYIGSSPQCEIYLFKDPQIEPQHAAIHKVPGGYDIEDLRSGAGTLVGGAPVGRRRLRAGDTIQIGGTTLLFQEKE